MLPNNQTLGVSDFLRKVVVYFYYFITRRVLASLLDSSLSYYYPRKLFSIFRRVLTVACCGCLLLPCEFVACLFSSLSSCYFLSWRFYPADFSTLSKHASSSSSSQTFLVVFRVPIVFNVKYLSLLHIQVHVHESQVHCYIKYIIITYLTLR